MPLVGRAHMTSKKVSSSNKLRSARAMAMSHVRRTKGEAAGAKALTARHLCAMLPSLHRHTHGKAFRVQALRSWLSSRIAGKDLRLPTVVEVERLLAGLLKARAGGDELSAHNPTSAWQPQGLRYQDLHEPGTVDNLQGFEQGPPRGATSWVAWNEYGYLYRLSQVSGERAARGACYEVVRAQAFKRLSCTVERRTLVAHTERGKAQFKHSVVLEPRRLGVGRVKASWSLIYLHGFSSRGTNYIKSPHYFGVTGANVRVILPTAPFQEQTCFKDWIVWRGEKLKWRRIKFHSWFDYLTDKGGRSENHLNLESKLEMREGLHALIDREVQRIGDPRRVILGGASQGCCVALDAALTYPEVLGGVIGVVGHVLGSTPLEPSKRHMPLHLFHEATDGEMKWSWVKGTVQRLVDAGFNVISRREKDPAGCGHWIQDIEGQWVRQGLRRIVHGHSSRMM